MVALIKPVPPDRTAGSAGHVGDHPAINAVLRELQAAGFMDITDVRARFAETLNGAGAARPTRFIISDGDPTIAVNPEDVVLNTAGAAIQDTGWFADRAPVACSTVPVLLTNGALTLTNGGIFAAYAVSKTTRTYTSVRFHVITQGTAATDMFVGVWALDGTLLGQTANIAAGNTIGAVTTAALTAPLSLSAGVAVYIGISTIGGATISVLRYQIGGGVAGSTSAVTAATGVRVGWSVSGNAATSAAPPALTGTTQSANIPWIELT